MSSLDTVVMGSISDEVDYGQGLPVSHAKLHFKETFVDDSGDTVILNYQSILDKYYDIIQVHITQITLTDTDFIKYKFQPKMFCADTYDNPELWSQLLRINNMTSCAEFTNQTFNVFTPDIFDVINEIFILEADNINDNNIEVYGS